LVLNQLNSNNLDNAEAIERYTGIDVVVFNKENQNDFIVATLALVKQG